MTKLDKELIKEDLEFICDYIIQLKEKYPCINDEVELFQRIARRMDDIDKRVGA